MFHSKMHVWGVALQLMTGAIYEKPLLLTH